MNKSRGKPRYISTPAGPHCKYYLVTHKTENVGSNIVIMLNGQAGGHEGWSDWLEERYQVIWRVEKAEEWCRHEEAKWGVEGIVACLCSGGEYLPICKCKLTFSYILREGLFSCTWSVGPISWPHADADWTFRLNWLPTLKWKGELVFFLQHLIWSEWSLR